jgi:hypothetical protein
MLEYVFFQELPRKRFQEYLKEQGLIWTLESGEMETLVVIDEAGVDEELAERIESVYDELFAMEQAIFEERAPKSADRLAEDAILVCLKDGRTVRADLPPELVSRVLLAISPEELKALVDAVASAVENPDEYPRARRGDGGERTPE